MKNTLRLVILMLLAAPAAPCAESVTKQFLRYIYGADGIELTNVCHPTDDAWMLRGAKDTNALAEIDEEKFTSKRTGVTTAIVGTDICFIELREGRVDPAFYLDGIYMLHRRLVQAFISSALSRNQRTLSRVATDPNKVQIVGPKAPPGEMGQYDSIIEAMPVLRASKPADDAKSKTVTYRVPVGEVALSLTLVKQGGTWMIDTSKTVRVPLEFFFR